MQWPDIDPTAAPAPPNRRLFVSLSAGAVVGASTARGSAAGAAGGDFGKPHPPVVPEDDPAIQAEHVTLSRPDAAVGAYASWPKNAGPATPSVVVIMHIWGVDEQIRDVVRRLAKAGFGAIAPDLYARFGAPSGDDATDYTIFRPYAQKLDRLQWLGDVRAAADWLRTTFPNTKTGIMGFCMGGRLVLIAITQQEHVFAAAAPFYGSVAEIDPASVHTPICGSYGGRDTGIPADSVRAFAAALTVPNDFHIYDDAGHGFFDDRRSSYVASAAQDAWMRTIEFFQTHLRGSQ